MVRAVVAGDLACGEMIARRWAGAAGVRRLRAAPGSLVLPRSDPARTTVCFLRRALAGGQPWPGGALLWLVPERGPSMPDLALLRGVLDAHGDAIPELRIAVCARELGDPSSAARDVDAITTSCALSLPGDRPFSVELVVFEGEGANVEEWLRELGRT